MVSVLAARVFLSGPVTGLDRDEAYAAFMDARKALRRRGARECWVPMAFVPGGATHEEAMLKCLSDLTAWEGAEDGRGMARCFDMLVSLPGWRDSAGARLEREVAEACGIPCHDLAEVVGE